MKKKLLFPCLLLTLAMLFACLFTFGASAATVSMTDVAGGTAPAAGDIVTISNEAELKAFSKYVSDGGVTEGITFRLENDIELTFVTAKHSGQYLTTLNPIGGKYNGAAENVAFKGTFDGNGKTISNFNVTNAYIDATGAKNRDANASVGALFAAIDGGTVKDLTLGVYQIAQVGEPNGAVAATATGATFLNCSVIADDIDTATPVTQTNQINITKSTATAVGGIVGTATDSVIDGCNVNLAIKGYKVVAGIVGVAENTAVRNCVVGGTYTNTQSSVIGGVAGELTGTSTVKNCYSSATLDGKATDGKATLGGVVGVVGADALVENCFSGATVKTGAMLVSGSLVGENNGTVKHSFGLRLADKTRFDAHADIGNGENGVAEQIYAYTVTTEGDATVFTVGTITPEKKDINCWDAPHMGGTCTADAPGCGTCNQGLLSLWVYDFVPSEDASIANLADALNAWVAVNDDADYAAWVVNGATIVNCKHGTTKYVAYAGQEPNCTDVGHGDLVCALCNMLVEANVDIPATPDVHTSPDGKIYPCVAFECVYCHETIEATLDHAIDPTLVCKDQTCSRCHSVIEATVPHTRPEGFDESKPCAEYLCTLCGTRAHDVEHDAPAVTAPCQDSICSVCNQVVHAGNGLHLPGLAPTCTRAQFCMDCGQMINPARGHSWGDPANCGYAQICTVCEIENPDEPATGEHVLDSERGPATCTENSYCAICDKVIDYAFGHTKEAGSVDCGHGKSCTVCHTILESATGEHDIDWTDVVVVRPATPTRTGIVVATCADCEREMEGYISCVATDAGARVTVTVDGENNYFYAGTTLNVDFAKVADYKALAYANGYVPLQAVTVAAVDAMGEEVAIGGTVTVKLILNNSAVRMDSDDLKIYAVNGTTLTEATDFEVEDGYVTFTAVSADAFVIAAEKEAAVETLGTVSNPILPETETASVAPITDVLSVELQEQPVAAFVGTYSYEKKNDEI